MAAHAKINALNGRVYWAKTRLNCSSLAFAPIVQLGACHSLRCDEACIPRSADSRNHLFASWRGSALLFAKQQRAVFGINIDSLAFADFAFEDVDAQRVENFFLNGAPKRTRTVNGIVTFAREKFLG